MSLISSTSTLASVGSTLTALLALTTPFVAPPSCSTISQYTTVTTTKRGDPNNSTTFAGIFSNPSDPNYGDCQPSGWGGQQSFSPAVCPSSWAAFRLSTIVSSGTVVSTAFCCASGYSPHDIYYTPFEGPFEGSGAMCTSIFKPHLLTTMVLTLSDSSTATATKVFPTGGWLVHPAWHIAWQESDLASLVPRPPDITSNKEIYKWTPLPPGATPSVYIDYQAISDREDRITLILATVIPIVITFLSIASCYFCCCRKRRRQVRADKKARKAEAELERVQGQVLLANVELEDARLRVAVTQQFEQLVVERIEVRAEEERRRSREREITEAPPPAYEGGTGGEKKEGGDKGGLPAYERGG